MFVVTSCLGGWQVRPNTISSPPIATFSLEADARMFAGAKEAQYRRRVEANMRVTFCEDVYGNPSGPMG